VDDEIHVVEQNPLRLLVALHVGGTQTRSRESLLYLIGDGLNLPGVATGADDKKISKPAGGLVELEHGDVFRLFFLGGGDGVHHLALQFVFLRHETSEKAEG
jgi:hypothetical protein